MHKVKSLSLSEAVEGKLNTVRFFHATALEVTICRAALVRWFMVLSLRFPFHNI